MSENPKTTNVFVISIINKISDYIKRIMIINEMKYTFESNSANFSALKFFI